MTNEDVDLILSGVIPSLKEYVAEQLGPLQARIADLENRPVLRFVGPWRENTTYSEGCLAQKGSALWLAISESEGLSPGTDEASGYWRLVVKTHS